MQEKKIILIGASGHAKVIVDILEQSGQSIAFLQDNNPALESLAGYPVHQQFPETENPSSYLLCIGSNAIRKKLAPQFPRFATAIHPKATVARTSSVAEGTVVMAGATINPDSTIGRHCIINTNSSVDHDCHLADFVHLSPNATLCGGVTVGEGTHLGAGSVVIPGVNIGSWCVIGAGTVVIKDIPDGCTVVGNPGRIVRQNSINA